MVSKLKNKYKDCEDVVFYKLKGFDLIYTSGLVNKEYIESKICKILLEHPLTFMNHIVSIECIDEVNLDESLFSGKLIIIKDSILYSVNTINMPKRSLGMSEFEYTLTGPKDGFIENLETNIALIRKRMKNHFLHVHKYMIGNKSLCLLYDVNIDHRLLNTITNILIQNKDNNFQNLGELKRMLSNRYSLFPTMISTSRSDFCEEAIHQGKVVLLVDDYPIAFILPITYESFYYYNDDLNESLFLSKYHHFFYKIALFLSIFLMPFILAIYTFHPEHLPYILLANISSIHKGMILPIHLEILLSIFLFELFSIAGMRFSKGISATLLVIGSSMLGSNITSSGLIGYDIIVFNAISVICSYSVSTLPSFTIAIKLLSYFSLLCSYLFGFIGFVFSLIIIIFYLSNNKSFSYYMMEGVNH